MTQAPEAPVEIFSSPSSWIETAAIDQCKQVAQLEGMLHVAGMPDLHPGKGAPIGAAMLADRVYPFLVGSDIGCGIAVFPLHIKKVAPERLAKNFPNLDETLPEEDTLWDEFDREVLSYLTGFATVGRGNHFVELSCVEEILELEHAKRLNLSKNDLVLIVHSGSRGLGEDILRDHTALHGAAATPDQTSYLKAHDHAHWWASQNRLALAMRTADALGGKLGPAIVDQCHNMVTPTAAGFLHRKGAAPGNGQDVLVAGTRGTLSYLVSTHSPHSANFSVAHGAGRKMSRQDALGKNRARYTASDLSSYPVGIFRSVWGSSTSLRGGAILL